MVLRCIRPQSQHTTWFLPSGIWWSSPGRRSEPTVCDLKSEFCSLTIYAYFLILPLTPILRMFYGGRFVSGLSIGILVTVCPMYLAEVSSAYVRGWVVGHHAIFLVFGYMLAGWVGYACYFATAKNVSFAWRFPLCLQTMSPLILFIGSYWIPRSPRWLISKGKFDEAWQVLRDLRRSREDPEDLVAKEEFYQTKEQLGLEAQKLAETGHGVWTAVLKRKSYRKRMIIGFLTQWGAEFGGPLIIVSYTRNHFLCIYIQGILSV